MPAGIHIADAGTENILMGIETIPTSRCGKNTHFRQIYFAVPNLKYVYIYIYISKKIRDAPRKF